MGSSFAAKAHFGSFWAAFGLPSITKMTSEGACGKRGGEAAPGPIGTAPGGPYISWSHTTSLFRPIRALATSATSRDLGEISMVK